MVQKNPPLTVHVPPPPTLWWLAPPLIKIQGVKIFLRLQLDKISHLFDSSNSISMTFDETGIKALFHLFSFGDLQTTQQNVVETALIKEQHNWYSLSFDQIIYRFFYEIFSNGFLACKTSIGIGRALLVICLSCIVHCLCWLQKRCARSHLLRYRYVNCIVKW